MAVPVNDTISVDAGESIFFGMSQYSDWVQQYPGNPQWFMYNGAPRFILGPGEPEAFLYDGTLQPDGTRAGGAQSTIISNITANNGKAIYFIFDRDPGDAPDNTHNPWTDNNPANGLDPERMTQWDGWFDSLEAAGIISFVFFFDDHDSQNPRFGTGDTCPAGEITYFNDMIARHGHRKNFIWMTGEESDEGFSAARVSAQGAAIRAAAIANGYPDLVIGSHQRDGTTFFHASDANVRVYGIQRNNRTPAQMNADMNAIRADAEANGFIGAMIERGDSPAPTGNEARQIDWACFMGGMGAVLRYEHFPADMVSTPPTESAAADQSDMKNAEAWINTTTFYTMSPDNSLAANGTDYVLANPGEDYILYAVGLSGDMGCQSMTAGDYDAYWYGCDTYEQVTVSGITVSSGTNTFTKPAGITTNECAVFLKRVQS